MKVKVLITGLALVLAASFLVSGKKTDLTGKIQDYSGMGIVLGTLEIYTKDAGHQLISSVETGLNGEFTLNDLTPGLYELVIQVPGFEKKIQTIDVTPETENLGVINLEGNVITLAPVVIYGKRS